MTSIHRSIFFSAVERYGSLLLLLFSTAALSRLLTPKEFGVCVLINALNAVIIASFQEFGGANYLIQKTSLSKDDIRTAFTITFCISGLIGVGLYGLGGVLAWFFRQDAIRIGIAVSAFNFFLTPVSVTVTALLRRDMRFGALTACNLVSGFTAAAVSILLAIMKYSFMALIWGSVAANIVLVALLVCLWGDLKIFRPSLSAYRDVIRFGLYSSGVSVINVFYNLAPQLFLARILDFAAVGLYGRAVGVTQMFDRLVMQVLSPVIMPAILVQTKAGVELKRIYLDSIELIAVVQWPFLIFIAVMAQPIILIWLGPTWLEIVPLIRMLCIASLAMFAAGLSYPVFVAAGAVRDALTSSLISLPPSLALIFAASFLGVEAVAASALVTLPFQAAVAIYFIARHLALKPSDLLRALEKSGIVTLWFGVAVLSSAVIIDVGLVGPVPGLLMAVVFAAVSWWLGLVFTQHPLLSHLQLAMGSFAFVAPAVRFAGQFNATRSDRDER
jgi:O-antigen/teichoic acid export membrane protein